MKKLVVLKLDGDFNQGFSVSLEIGEDGKRGDVELNDSRLRLHPIPKLPNIYQEWCRSYRGLDGYRIKFKKEQLSHIKISSLKEKCQTKADKIKFTFTDWLKADSFYRIKEECLIHLSPDDEIRFIIRTTELQLRKLPWHLWDLVDKDYPKAEITLSVAELEHTEYINTSSSGNKIKILAILGDS